MTKKISSFFSLSSCCKQIYILLTVISLFALPTERKLLFTYTITMKGKGERSVRFQNIIYIHIRTLCVWAIDIMKHKYL